MTSLKTGAARVAGTLVLLLATATTPAFGQTTGGSAGSPPVDEAETTASADLGLGDIVVTARRVQENLQKVPVTASVFDGAGLRARSILTPQDLTQSVSGIFLSGSGSVQNAQYAIRGTSKPVAGAGAPGVVTYFADVPLPPFVSSTPQFDIASLQVLKGPQGTLFGRNTVGGALLIYPVAPGPEWDGYIQGSYGNYDARVLEGALNVPILSGKVALRIAGRLDRVDGYFRNLGAGGDLGNQHDNNVRASLLLKPVDWITNTTIFDYAEQPRGKGHGAAQIVTGSGLPVPFIQALIEAQRARGPYIVDTGAFAQFDGWRNWGITNRTDLDFGAVSITNIFGYRNVLDDSLTSFDGLPGPFFDSYQKVRNRQFSDELQIRGKLFDDHLSWLVGGFYSRNPPEVKVNDSDLGFLGVPDTPLQYSFYGERSQAVFGNLNYEVLRGVHVSGGFRYTWDSYSVCSGNGELDLPANYRPSDCRSKLTDASSNSGKSSAPTWTVGADWQVTDDLFVYVTSRRGYKSGGLNSPTLGMGLAAYQTFTPEKTTDVEIGAKSSFSIGSVKTRLNVSAFTTQTKGKQLIGTQIATSTYQLAGLACLPPTFTPFIDGDCNPANDPSATVLTLNGGDLRTRGVEFDLTVQPAKGFSLSAGGTLLDSKTTRFAVPPVLGAFFPVGEIPLLFTPKKTFTFGVSQTLPLPDRIGEVSFNGQVYHSGEVDFYGFVAPAYTVINARLDWNGAFGTPADLGFYVRNALSEKYVTGSALTSASAIPANSVLFGAPRTYGIQLRYRFGASAAR